MIHCVYHIRMAIKRRDLLSEKISTCWTFLTNGVKGENNGAAGDSTTNYEKLWSCHAIGCG